MTAEDSGTADEWIAQFERRYRLEMPGTAPGFCVDAARWAGTRFFRACQFAVFRDVGEDVLDEALGELFPLAASPTVCYSVDIVFRYLPSLLAFAKSAAERDPLLSHLRQWARDWPLSSVGVTDVGEFEIEAFAEDACLLQLYVDRIIEAEDLSRLADPRVREAVRGVLGMFGSLKSGMVTALEQYETEETAE